MKNWKSIFCYGLVLLIFAFLLESLAYIRTEVEREIALEKSKSLSRAAQTKTNVCFIVIISNLKQRTKFNMILFKLLIKGTLKSYRNEMQLQLQWVRDYQKRFRII